MSGIMLIFYLIAIIFIIISKVDFRFTPENTKKHKQNKENKL